MAAGNGANTFDAKQVHGAEPAIVAEVVCLAFLCQGRGQNP